MKLIIKVIAASGVSGGKAIALCTEDGNLVGQQVSCAVENEVDAMPTITVRFHIDGDQIRFADNGG